MERTERGTRVRRVSIGLLLAALGIVGIGLAWPHEPLLTQVGRPVIKADSMKQDLCWLSVDRLLIVTTKQVGGFVRGKAHPAVWTKWQGSADLLDTSNHKTSHLTDLTDLLQRTIGNSEEAPMEFKASPDSQWLFWNTYTGNHGTPLPHSARLDGTHYRALHRTFMNNNFFFNSHSLVQILWESLN